jgi:Iron-containing redox enzyme
MKLPHARGPLSLGMLDLLQSSADARHISSRRFRRALDAVTDPCADEDFQLALALNYELLYHRIADVDARWEWHPALVTRRSLLEQRFEAALRDRVPQPHLTSEPVWEQLRALVDADTSPSLSRFVTRRADLAQFRQFLMQRSIYHLREADAHTWAIPRLQGTPKAALVEIQADEYGGGRPGRMHAQMFAATMRAAELDDSYGAYWNDATAETFAGVNLITLLGLHSRLRGALCGHLAAFEMTSTRPNRDYGRAVRRLGLPEPAAAFFDEHVQADAAHEQIAAVDLCGSLAEQEPELAPQILWGAACGVHLDASAASVLLDRWSTSEQAVAS